MSRSERVNRLADLLMTAWHAHHEATGGPDPEWPRWYAGFLEEEIRPHVGVDVDAGTIEEWLTVAERRHREDTTGQDWAPAYASVILELSAATG